MSARDELAHDIPQWTDIPFGGGDDFVKLDANAAHSIAGVLIEKGYRKPRTITTAEELDALPVGSVILDPIGLSLHKNALTGWCASNGAKEIPADMLAQEALPATVLHTPEES